MRTLARVLLVLGGLAAAVSLDAGPGDSAVGGGEALDPAAAEALENVIGLLSELREEGPLADLDELIAKLRADIGRYRMQADHASRQLGEMASDSPEADELRREHEELSRQAHEMSGMVEILRAIHQPPADPSIGGELLGMPPADTFSEGEIDGLVRWIDELFEKVWAARGIAAAPPADDATFLRRAALDLGGRLPSVAEIEAFHAEEGTSAQRRARLIDSLVESPGYAATFASFWDVHLLGRGYLPDDKHRRPFVEWLERELARNTPYDRFVTELITNTGTNTKEVSPTLFLAARQSEAAANTTKVMSSFLGLQLQCAQCHDDPYQSWTQDDFHSLAAFFIRQKEKDIGGNVYVLYDDERGEATYQTPAGKKVTASPRYHDGTSVSDFRLGEDGNPLLGEDGKPLPSGLTRRQLFAHRMVGDLQFARSQVNRLWAHLLGRGLVEPVEAFGDDNPPSVPLVLDVLARRFQESGFDNRWLLRVIGRTRVYSLASAPAARGSRIAESFARFPLKASSAEQVFDSISAASRLPEALRRELEAAGKDPAGAEKLLGALRDDFIKVYGWEPEKVIDPLEGTLPQALALINGRLLAEACSPRPGSLVGEALALAPEERVRLLYRAALVRAPRPAELVRALAHLAAAPDAAAATGDVLWALFNSAEFRYNH
jgi:hypothetical protein